MQVFLLAVVLLLLMLPQRVLCMLNTVGTIIKFTTDTTTELMNSSGSLHIVLYIKFGSHLLWCAV